MEKRLRFLGLFIAGISLVSFALLLSAKFPLLALIPALYGVGLGAVLYFLAPRMAQKQAELARGQAAANPGLKLSRGQLWRRGLAIFLVVISAGVGSAITTLYPPLWAFHTILPAIAIGLALGTLAYQLRRGLKTEISRTPGVAAPAPTPEEQKAQQSAALPIRAAVIAVVALTFLVSNTALDRAPAQEEKVLVQGRYQKSSKNSRSYYADLGPLRGGGFTGWPESTGVRVNSSEYESLEPGRSFATLRIKPGFWRLPWIESATLKTPSAPSGEGSAKAARRLIEEARLKKRAERPFRPAETHREVNWPNGQLKERVPLVKGKEEGIGRYWHSNGRLYAEIPWRDGQKDGHFLLYREDGTVEQDLSYKEGKPHGVCRWYKPDGRLERETIYFEGQPR